MKKYKITIPAFIEEIYAENEDEALEIFFFDYDNSERESEFNQPIIKEIKATKRPKRHKN